MPEDVIIIKDGKKHELVVCVEIEFPTGYPWQGSDTWLFEGSREGARELIEVLQSQTAFKAKIIDALREALA